MTQKDYVVLAEALKRAKPSASNDYGLFVERRKVWCTAVAEVAHALHKDNPNFSYGRFYLAAGLEDA